MANPTRLIGFSFAVPALIACCAVGPDMSPSILSQRNVIVWDSKTKTEKFIRQAAFETETEDFGFIVATPTIPKISEVHTSILRTLAMLDPVEQTRKAEIARRGVQSKSSAATGGVSVLQVEDAGAYTITTLEASDAVSLEAWLKSNKYTLPPDVREWINAYIAKKWLFSAFKFKADRVNMMGNLPCLTFKTDEPFAPYRVPKSNRTKTESLEVYFISDEPYGGFVQDKRLNIDEWTSRVHSKVSTTLSTKFKDHTLIPDQSVVSYMKADFPTDAKDDMVFRPVEKEVFEEPKFFSPVQFALPVAVLASVGCIAWAVRRKRVM